MRICDNTSEQTHAMHEDAKNDAAKRYDMTQDVLETDLVKENGT